MEEIRDVRENWKHSVASSHGSPGLLILSVIIWGLRKPEWTMELSSG